MAAVSHACEAPKATRYWYFEKNAPLDFQAFPCHMVSLAAQLMWHTHLSSWHSVALVSTHSAQTQAHLYTGLLTGVLLVSKELQMNMHTQV
jgi:hypothetical protein